MHIIPLQHVAHYPDLYVHVDLQGSDGEGAAICARHNARRNQDIFLWRAFRLWKLGSN